MTEKQSSFPATVDEAVRLLTDLVPDDEQAGIAALLEADLVDLHFGLGKWVRNNLGLWSPDSPLLKATGQTNADDALDLIVRAFWQKLKDAQPKIQ